MATPSGDGIQVASFWTCEIDSVYAGSTADVRRALDGIELTVSKN